MRVYNVIAAILLMLSLVMMAGCSIQPSHIPTWPSQLTVIELSDGGVCLDADSASHLAELRAELENY